MSPPLTIRDVFTDCQGGMHSHGRLIKSLTKVYKTDQLEDFWETFLNHLKYSLIVFKREPAVERTIEFVAKFATSLCLDEKREKEEKKAECQDEDEEEDDMHPFLLKLFSFLLKHHNANDKAVRFRCCQLVNKLLASLGDDAQIADDLYDKIYECMLQRLRDKFPMVRIQSVLALARLQDPNNKDCPVINAYLFLLGCDPNPDARRAVLSCIAATTKTLPAMLERTRDTKDLVRKLAYQVIADKIHVRALTIAQRVSLLKDGLNDRAVTVKESCTTRLIQAWLRNFQGNILKLLKCLDVENALDVSNQLLKALFEKSPCSELLENFDILNEDLVVPIEELDSESVLYWRSLCSFLKAAGQDAEEHLDKILPTGSVLAKYIQTFSDHMKAEENLEAQLRNEFILQQMLELATIIDFFDEVGRRQMGQVMKSLLLSEHIMHSLVKPIMELFKLLHSEPTARVAALVEMISDIREPMSLVENARTVEQQRQRDLKMASIRVELNQLREDLDTCVHKQEFERAAEIKTKVTELQSMKENLMDESAQSASQMVRIKKDDPVTMLKCMTIACEMLEDSSIQGLSPVVQTLMEALILPGITDQEPAIRNTALKALGLCCLLKRDTAKAHLLLFMQVAQIDQEGIKVTALKIIFDLLLTFGLEAFEVDTIEENTSQADDKETDTPFGDDDDDILNLSQSHVSPPSDDKEEKTKTASSVLNILVTLLDCESSEVRTIAAIGLAKLMLCGRLISAKVISRLLLLWYNPVTEDDLQLRHHLGAFFPIFAFADRSNQYILEEAFLPTLRTLSNAPPTSPLAEVNATNVAELMAQLTCSRHLVNKPAIDDMEEMTPHDNLAVRICNEILSDSFSFNIRTLCHVLNSLEISSGNITLLKDIKVLTQRMIKEVRDHQCSKILKKFHKTNLDALILATEGMDTSMVEEIEATKDQFSCMEVNDETNTQENVEEELEILPDCDGDTTGISRIHSKRSKSSNTTLIASINAKRTKSDHGSVFNDSDAAEDSVFASPKPVKHSTRSMANKDQKATSQSSKVGSALKKQTTKSTSETPGSKASPSLVRRSTRNTKGTEPKASPTPTRHPTRAKLQTKKSGKATSENMCKKLDYLSGSDSQPSDNDAPIKGSGRTRGQHNRTPLSDIENEVQ